MRKKGDLTNQALSVLIAVIGILLIAYGIYKLYDVVRNNENKNAQKTIDVLNEKIKFLEEGNSGIFTVQGFKNSQNWYIAGWTGGTGPDKCFLNSCLCICKGNPFETEKEHPRIDPETGQDMNIYDEILSEEKMESYCQDSGYCRNIEFDRVEVKDSLIGLNQGLLVINATIKKEQNESKLIIESLT